MAARRRRADAGDLEDAAKFAYLGHVGTHDMRERTERIASLHAPSSPG